MEPALPVPPQERIVSMDVLRGFALLGILLVNILFFCGPMQENLMRPWREAAHPWLRAGVTWLVQGKFYCLFSFLFGMGFSVQMSRLESRGAAAGRIYSRRLLALLAIGILHGTLIWMGDILAFYALAGFLLLAFRKRQPRTLLIWAACLLAVGGLLYLFFWMVLSIALSVPAAAQEIAKQELLQKADQAKKLAETLQAYGHGPYALLLRVRLRELLGNYGMTLGVLPQILAMFLLGAWTGRKGILKDPGTHRGLLIRVALWGFALGLPANAWYAWSMGQGFPGPSNPGALLAFALYVPAAPALALAYASSLVLALQHPALASVLRLLAAPGRMALTSYLTHSLVMTTVFYFYGFGLYGRLSLPTAYGLALILYGLQLPLSAAWLARFSMGPVEWVWRSLTYGTAPAFRRIVQ
jgi:uncharacterized protein